MLHKALRTWKLETLVLGLLFVVPLRAATAPATVQGSVLDDSGKPVPGAHVLISSTPPASATRFVAPPVITGPLAAMVAADSHGIFTVASLPAGQYIACAEVTTPGLLDPCHWAASAPTFTVSAGKATATVDITMARGAVVPIHVDDPGAILKAVTGVIDFDLQIHIITSKGHHYNAAIGTSGPFRRDHSVTIPFGTPVLVQVLSPHLMINDLSGKPVSPTGTSVMVPAGAPPAAIGYVVAGKK